jgi:6,7-dimethyl-8-ribityllumazine synthase
VPPSIAIITSRYNSSITGALREGALEILRSRRGPRAAFELIDAPGSYELTALALAAARTGRFEGVVALGCLIKGQTLHDRYIAQSVALGLTQVTLATGIPVAFGVITAETAAQARARAGGGGGRKGNKGAEAMAALLDTLAAMERLRHPARSSTVAPASNMPPDKARPPRPPRPPRPEQQVHQPVIERQPALVDLPGAFRHNPRPRDAEPVRPQPDRRHQPDILGRPVVMVARGRPRLPEVHRPRTPAEGLIDR